MMNDSRIDTLTPAALWRHFSLLASTPRCSGCEAAVRDSIVALAKSWGLSYQVDAVGNLVVRKPAARSLAHRPPVALQAHLDMVCEQNAGTTHDFSRDPIPLVIDGEWVRAENTTLGADNGIAVAMMLALLEGDYQHPALECLFTVDEESGLVGALGLEPTLLQARRLINLDSEEEGTLVIGCAGGRNTYATFNTVRASVPAGHVGLRLSITGLQGGHSGGDIHLQRGNALVLGARILHQLLERRLVAICALHGGDKHNAIPREFFADLACDPAHGAEVERLAHQLRALFAQELGDRDPQLQVQCLPIAPPADGLTTANATTVVRALLVAPHGVLGMSLDVPGLVETSSNLAAIRTNGTEISILTSQRSSRASLIDWAAAKVGSGFELAGAVVRYAEAYPGWPPNPRSALLAAAGACYRELHGAEPEVKAFHAGLECGVIGAKIPGMDMISLGPNVEGAHTPSERVHIASTARVFEYLCRLLPTL